MKKWVGLRGYHLCLLILFLFVCSILLFKLTFLTFLWRYIVRYIDIFFFYTILLYLSLMWSKVWFILKIKITIKYSNKKKNRSEALVYSRWCLSVLRCQNASKLALVIGVDTLSQKEITLPLALHMCKFMVHTVDIHNSYYTFG